MRADDFVNEADEESRKDKAMAAAMANIMKQKADIDARNAKVSDTQAYDINEPKYDVEDYKSLLARHDWYYDYSDDHSVWTRGSNERNTLYKYQEALDPDYKIWNEYAPEMFQRKVQEGYFMDRARKKAGMKPLPGAKNRAASRLPESVTTRTGAGNVTTVGGKEIARSTPKIGGAQTTQYADGSIKTVSNTTGPDGTNIRKTQVAGIGQKQGVTNAKISQGNTAVNLNFDGSSNKIDPKKATSAGMQYKVKADKIKTVGNMNAFEQDSSIADKINWGNKEKRKDPPKKKNGGNDGIVKKAMDTVKNIFTEEEFDEAAGEKDACYHKVKARYKVWPSAYASAALSKCRKVGADNWGNKSKK